VDALIVGAGASGFLHALALRAAGVRIAAIHDPDVECAKSLADLVGGRATESIGIDADVVAICSPPAFHVAQAEIVARPGRIVFIEKPIAVSAPELARLAALPGIVPVLQWRAGRSAHLLRAAFGQGTFGARPRILCDFRLWRDADYWRSRGEDSWPCGALLSIGIHAVDLLLACVGRPVTRALVSDERVRGQLALEFDDGTTACVRIALDAPSSNTFELLIRGEQAWALLSASEADPTASPLSWHGAAPPVVTTGATGSPLLVPYIHAALFGERVGVRDVATAHALLTPAPGRASHATSSKGPPDYAASSLAEIAGTA
jgi:predicted dehydrogenase